MRGSPLLRALIAFLILLSVGWPLWRLTQAEDAPPQAAVVISSPTEKKAIGLQLTFTAVPKSLTVRHLEAEVWTEPAPAAELEHEIQIPFPKQGVDLQFHLEWPDEAVWSAARVRLTDPDGEVHEKTIWGKGAVDEVLTFP
jgi:hypothetical protein